LAALKGKAQVTRRFAKTVYDSSQKSPGQQAPSLVLLPRGEIQLWPFGHDAARVDHAQAAGLNQIYRQAARLLAKGLRGAKPADLPVQQPTTFKLVVTLKTAKALRLAIPESFLVRADAVVE
jgi:hypothetical protein